MAQLEHSEVLVRFRAPLQSGRWCSIFKAIVRMGVLWALWGLELSFWGAPERCFLRKIPKTIDQAQARGSRVWSWLSQSGVDTRPWLWERRGWLAEIARSLFVDAAETLGTCVQKMWRLRSFLVTIQWRSLLFAHQKAGFADYQSYIDWSQRWGVATGWGILRFWPCVSAPRKSWYQTLNANGHTRQPRRDRIVNDILALREKLGCSVLWQRGESYPTRQITFNLPWILADIPEILFEDAVWLIIVYITDFPHIKTFIPSFGDLSVLHYSVVFSEAEMPRSSLYIQKFRLTLAGQFIEGFHHFILTSSSIRSVDISSNVHSNCLF